MEKMEKEKDAKQTVSQVKEKLLKDLPFFLENSKDFKLAQKIGGYCSDALKELEGAVQPTEQFSKFINVLYGCQQLDDFGEPWAPTKEKVENWIGFLEKFEF